MGWADLRQPHRFPELALVKPDIVERTGGDWHEVSASLYLSPHPGEDIGLLGDLVVEDASAGWLGLTVVGARDA